MAAARSISARTRGRREGRTSVGLDADSALLVYLGHSVRRLLESRLNGGLDLGGEGSEEGEEARRDAVFCSSQRQRGRRREREDERLSAAMAFSIAVSERR